MKQISPICTLIILNPLENGVERKLKRLILLKVERKCFFNLFSDIHRDYASLNSRLI